MVKITLLDRICYLTRLKHINENPEIIEGCLLVEARHPVTDDTIRYINLAADALPENAAIKEQVSNQGDKHRGVVVYFQKEWKPGPSQNKCLDGINYEALSLSRLIDSVLQPARIKERYKRQKADWLASEGDKNFDYIPQKANHLEKMQDPELFSAADEFVADTTNRILLLLGDAGMGKTSFCKAWTYRFEILSQNLPLLFFLNEFKAGDFRTFITSKLQENYGYKVDFPTFAYLCQAGFFTILLDGFDQMLDHFSKQAFERDIADIEKISQGNGKLILTSRNQRFRFHLDNLAQKESTQRLELTGFDKEERQAFLKNDNDLLRIAEALEKAQPHEQLHKKPVILKLIQNYSDAIKDRMASNSMISEFDMISLAFNKWEEKLDSDIIGNTTLFLRILAQRLSDLGLNRRVSLSSVCKIYQTLTNDEIFHKKLVEGLKSSGFFDVALLNQEQPELVFTATPYLEMLIASFVMAELKHFKDWQPGYPQFLRTMHLSRETMNYLLPWLSEYDTWSYIKKAVEQSKKDEVAGDYKTAANLISLLLRQMHETSGEQKSAWRRRIKTIAFKELKLEHADLQYLDLSHLKLSDSNLKHADLSYTRLIRTEMSRTDLEDTWFEEKGSIITTAFLHTDGNNVCFAGGSKNGLLIRWDNISKKLTATPVLDGHEIGQVLFLNTEEVLASAGGNHLYVLSREKKAIIATLPERITALVRLEGNKTIFGGMPRSRIWLKPETGHPEIITLQDSPAWVTGLDSIPGCDELLAACSNSTVFHLDSVGQVKAQYEFPGRIIEKLKAISADACLLLSQDKLYHARLDHTGNIHDFGAAKDFDYCKASGRAFQLTENKIISKSLNDSEEMGIPTQTEPNSIRVSADGTYLAVAGLTLELFMQKGDKWENILSERMQIDCTGLRFNDAKNLTLNTFRFFLERGADAPNTQTFGMFIDTTKFEIDHLDKSFKCFTCKQFYPFSGSFLIKERQLLCHNCGAES